MRLDIQAKTASSPKERVKAVDFHPNDPWIVTALYSGHIHIYNYETGSTLKTFETTDVPARAVRFTARKNWLVCGSDDFMLRAYNYNTSEKVASYEAHPDYIRAIAVHPTRPFVLTASDDMTIKCWDWEQSWKCIQTFEGHSHYVMGLAINPKDPAQFASASLDRTVKIWTLGSVSTASSTLEAHSTKGVNWVDFCPYLDRPFILTASDDRSVKVWDLTMKSAVATLEGHTQNVSFAAYHPELPIIISGSEDGTTGFGMASQRGQQGIGFGFDEGVVIIKMGKEEPAVSMDASGKLISVKNTDVALSIIQADESTKDNELMNLTTKDLGQLEIYPQSLKHSPNERFVAVCGDGEYLVFTALAWRQKAFGSGLDFAWASKVNGNDFAVLESALSIKLYRNFVEKNINFDFDSRVEGLTGGTLLGLRGADGIAFYDWQTAGLVRKIDVDVGNVFWSEDGRLVCLAGTDAFYILRFSPENYAAAVEASRVSDDGVDEAFEIVADFNEAVKTGKWIGDCFIFTTVNKVNYLVGDRTYTIAPINVPMYILGYIYKDSRLYLADRDTNIISFTLSSSVLEYQTCVFRGDMNIAAEILPTIPKSQLTKIARFLEDQGQIELAFETTDDSEHKLELALILHRLNVAYDIALEAKADQMFKSVGDAALKAGNIVLASQCFSQAHDLGSLLLLHSSTCDRNGLNALAIEALGAGAHNIAFSCRWLLGDLRGCLDILTRTGRLAEAAFFALTYQPSLAPKVVAMWQQLLDQNKKSRISKMIGTPGEDDDLFPEWDEWIRLENEPIAEEAATAS